MAIKSSSGPAGGKDRVTRALDALSFSAEESPDLAAEYGGQVPEDLLRGPLPVFGVDLSSIEALASGTRDLNALPQTGWRYLVLDDSQVQAADISADSDRPTFHVGGDLADRIAAAGRLAERRVDADTEYEPRLLEPAFLGDPVLWLKSGDPGQADRFFSLRKKPRELSREHLMGRLAAAAARKLTAFGSVAADYDEDADESGG